MPSRDPLVPASTPPPGGESLFGEIFCEQPELLRLLAGQVPCILWTTGSDLRYTATLGGGLSELGIVPGEGAGKRIADYHGPDEPIFDAHRRALAGESVTYETDFRGRVLWCHVRPLRGPEGVVGCIGMAVDITERRRAEKDLADSHRRLQALFDNALEAILLIDDNGRYVDANPAACALLGYSRDELLGLVISDVAPPPARAAIPDLWRQFLADGRMAGPYTFLRKDGTTRQAEFRAVANILPGLHLTVIRDVTERLRTETALLESERLHSTLVNSLGGIVWEADGLTFAFTFVSPQAEKILGYPVDQWLAEPDFWRRHTHPDDVDWTAAACRDATARGSDHAFEYRMIAADGRVVWLHDVVTVRTDTGGPVKLRGIMLDVTARKQAEADRRREQDFLQAVLDNIGEGIVASDAGERITLANWFARELSGVSAVPLPHAEWVHRFPVYRPDRKTPLEPEERPLIRALRGERFRGVELAARSPDQRWLTLVAAGQPLRDAGGGDLGAVVALRDVTEERRLEEQFRQAQKMEAVGQLAGGVAHDFNNLLTVINGYGEIVLGLLPAGNEARVLVEEISKAGQRAADLTRQLLAFSRRQMVTPKVLNLNELVADVERMLRRLIGEDISLVTRLRPDLDRVKADPSQMEQVVLNLALNARDAMPRGGTLTIETRNTELDEEYARTHPYARPGQYVTLAVSDTGSGIPTDALPHIFEPFFTTKGPGRGSGLGLATVYGIVQQSGGHVEVSTDPGRGSTFQVYLPRAEAPAAVSTHLPLPQAPRGAGTLLVVEDDPSVRALTCHVLRAAGYAVLEAGGGEEAIRIAEESERPVDLLVTDVIMPGLGGRELAEQLAARYAGLKVLYLSGYTEDAVVRHGVLEEQVNFLQKPFTPDSLAAKVREVLVAPPRTGRES